MTSRQSWALYTKVAAAPRSLALRHISFWVSYQPATHYWILQGVTGVVLILLGVIVTVVVVRRLRYLG